LKINRIEREALQHEQMVQKVKEIENLIEGVIDVSDHRNQAYKAALIHSFAFLPPLYSSLHLTVLF
jgi:hypothetical protein